MELEFGKPTQNVARILHVATQGSDIGQGTAEAPLRTISAAAELAYPGDTVCVHAGIYREEINPPRGGASEQERITYEAAKGEHVEIKGSEVISGWEQVEGLVWKVVLDNSFFGDFNPYSDLIRGDWFRDEGRLHHTGAVYLNDEWLVEADGLNAVFEKQDRQGCWFAEVTDNHTTIWGNFNGANPNDESVEINVRQSVFYPKENFINYITVRGFTMRNAATPWAPPTAEQIGLIGTNWSKGWIIEDNVISHSRCVGVTLGKYGDEWDNTSEDKATGYVETIERALKKGWHREIVGSHVVRNNRISHCEQAGIVGSLGAIFSEVYGNVIHDIHVFRLFDGAEQAGIKFHAAIDSLIRNNHVFRAYRGIWLDWMTQGTRVTGNLCHDNDTHDAFLEVNHGPYILDHNIFLSKGSIQNWSHGGAYIHNLFGGELEQRQQLERTTPFHQAHSTEIMGMSNVSGGDDRFINNLIVDAEGLKQYETTHRPSHVEANVVLRETPSLVKKDDGVYLQMDQGFVRASKELCQLVTSGLLGKSSLANLPFGGHDGQNLCFDKDYFGDACDPDSPCPGPLELAGDDVCLVKIWPCEAHVY
ncbi:right-handed parallel beta-helix repeat-containing protein [Rubellicoccus peritrichatus]|uniref:Right-handed parallel beta-helix repeat-containing protein n=1 Tax=Rubellicoccus peritrichatus TaxID=3080537 RepID=A0AAQ3QWB9_9BACT|nr:right-handed parallel beta-helix repeat-containing protein [Puniceicoccus sp. CR14]WOO42528.1 right-handed parallel beta-helix repeat-containing protein [Puniceicoccus sp. CR14]